MKHIRRRNYLILVIICMFGLMGCQSEETEQPPIASTASASPMATEEATSEPAPTSSVEPSAEPQVEPFEPITLTFAGDICLDDRFSIRKFYGAQANGVEDCFSPSILETMRSADIMMLNNEFPYSKRGKAIPGKDYTFCSDPDNAKILLDMGVDTVSLANNHTLDYGFEALTDTMKTLNEVNIRYSGAGMNIEEASTPVIYECQNRKIGYLSASKVLYQGNQAAGKDHEGLLSAYDPEDLARRITSAKGLCDYLVVYLHWGVEYKEKPEAWQREWAKKFIDAGADAIIGCHAHVIQGVEFYQDKPIVYSLGNYWFNAASKYSMLVTLTISEDNSTEICVTPCKNQGCKTLAITKKKELNLYFDYLSKISKGVAFENNGNCSRTVVQ